MRTVAPAPDTIVDGPNDKTLQYNYRHSIPTTFHTLHQGDVTVIITLLVENTTLGPDWDIVGTNVATGEHFAIWYNSRTTIGIEVN